VTGRAIVADSVPRGAMAPDEVERVPIVNARGETHAAPAPKSDRGGFYEGETGKTFGEPRELWIYVKARKR
jgi:hypothetical protein